MPILTSISITFIKDNNAFTSTITQAMNVIMIKDSMYQMCVIISRVFCATKGYAGTGTLLIHFLNTGNVVMAGATECSLAAYSARLIGHWEMCLAIPIRRFLRQDHA